MPTCGLTHAQVHTPSKGLGNEVHGFVHRETFSRLPSSQSVEHPDDLIANRLDVDFLFYKPNVMFPCPLEQVECGCLHVAEPSLGPS